MYLQAFRAYRDPPARVPGPPLFIIICPPLKGMLPLPRPEQQTRKTSISPGEKVEMTATKFKQMMMYQKHNVHLHTR